MAHLDDFTIQITEGPNTYKALVTFSCHCFTEEFKQHHTPGHIYYYDKETRAFCPIRHALSAALPGYMSSLAGKSVYLTNKSNFFILRVNGGNYLVVFNINRRTKKNYDVEIEVVTAHPRPEFAQYAEPVTFTKLVEAKATGAAVQSGPKVRIDRS
ncbi:hypothetical protein ASD36_00010 [Rhizobium sp. Root1334]|nr:hypothetical protein ASD36_00010 [Rhizobium sp. Root1334]